MKKFITTFDLENPVVAIRHDFDNLIEYWFHFGNGYVCITKRNSEQPHLADVCYDLNWLYEDNYDLIIDNRD